MRKHIAAVTCKYSLFDERVASTQSEMVQFADINRRNARVCSGNLDVRVEIISPKTRARNIHLHHVSGELLRTFSANRFAKSYIISHESRMPPKIE